jgi:hypothetical protein
MPFSKDMSGVCSFERFVEKVARPTRLRGRRWLHSHDRWMSRSCPLNAADVGATYRAGHGGTVDTTPDRMAAKDVLVGPQVREFRWYKGRRHYSDRAGTGRRPVASGGVRGQDPAARPGNAAGRRSRAPVPARRAKRDPGHRTHASARRGHETVTLARCNLSMVTGA